MFGVISHPAFTIFFHLNSSDPILLFGLRRKNPPRDRKLEIGDGKSLMRSY